jgi:hypothetical protein
MFQDCVSLQKHRAFARNLVASSAFIHFTSLLADITYYDIVFLHASCVCEDLTETHLDWTRWHTEHIVLSIFSYIT